MKKSDEYEESKELEYRQLVLSQKQKYNVHPMGAGQSKSTESILNRDSKKDAEHWNRSLDLSKAKAVDPWLVERRMSPAEFVLVEGMRRESKNTVGMSMLSATTPEKRQKAENAYLYSPGTRAEDLTPAEKAQIKPEKVADFIKPPEMEWKEVSPLKAFWAKLTGKPVRKKK